MSEQLYNLLILLRMFMSMLFTVINIFFMTEYRCSKKKAYLSIIGLFPVFLILNTYILFTYGFYAITRVFPFTMTIPCIILLIIITKDNIFKSQFNFWLQASIFGIIYYFTNYLEYIFHIGIIADIIIRLIIFCAVLFIYVKYLKKQYREFANIINKGWEIIATIPFLFTMMLFLLGNFPTPIEQRSENYLMVIILSILMLVVYTVIYITFKNTYSLMLKNQTEQSMRLQIVLQKEQYCAIQKKIEKDRAFRHDIRHHSQLLGSMLTKNKVDEAIAYLEKLEAHTLVTGVKIYAENIAANAILSSHLKIATERGIAVTCNAVVPQTLRIDEIEFCVILSNLLENAVEHCNAANAQSKPMLDVLIVQNREELCIKIQNSFNGELVMDEHGDYLSKKMYGGIGLKSVRAFAEKYQGVIDITNDEHVFKVFVALNLIQN